MRNTANRGQPPGSPENSSIAAKSLEAVDIAILDILSADSRQSARAVARKLGVSAGLVLERIRRMEANKVILGYRVEVNPLLSGHGILGFVLIHLQSTPDPEPALEYLVSLEETASAYLVSGGGDIFVTLRTRDLAHFQETLLKVHSVPGYFRSETMLSLAQRRRMGSHFAFVWEPTGPHGSEEKA